MFLFAVLPAYQSAQRLCHSFPRRSNPTIRACLIAFRRLWSRTSGASAIEFAIVAPVFFLFVITAIGYGLYFSTAHSVQQLVADAARASIAGMTTTERQALALDYIKRSTFDSILIDASKLKVSVTPDPGNSEQFTVEVSYDASSLPIWNLYAFALPGSEIARRATIRVGGI